MKIYRLERSKFISEDGMILYMEIFKSTNDYWNLYTSLPNLQDKQSVLKI